MNYQEQISLNTKGYGDMHDLTDQVATAVTVAKTMHLFSAVLLISGHRTRSAYRRCNIIDMEGIREATAKNRGKQRALKQRLTTEQPQSALRMVQMTKGKPIN